MLRQYRDIFGKPGEGAHAIRVGGIAVVDVAVTVAAAALIAYATSQSFAIVIVLLLLLGIVAHEAFGVRTAVNTWLFHSNSSTPCATPETNATQCA